MFGNTAVSHQGNSVLHFVSIENYTAELLAHIAAEAGKIWNGDLDGDDDLSIIKTELLDLFEGKTDLQKHGLVSEFICHLYLRSLGFEQHFLFRNLEEKGMKKGFDGLYMLSGKQWIYESKSTLSTTADGTHNDNVSEAYNDLKKKIEGVNHANNPWKNAYSHVMSRTIKEDATLSQTLKSFSNDYAKKKYHQINNFNVIPSSTIYLGDRWIAIDGADLQLKIQALIKRYTCAEITVLCLNKKSIDDFILFING